MTSDGQALDADFGIHPTGTKTITENGTGIDVSQFANVDVAVPVGAKNTLVYDVEFQAAMPIGYPLVPNASIAEVLAVRDEPKLCAILIHQQGQTSSTNVTIAVNCNYYPDHGYGTPRATGFFASISKSVITSVSFSSFLNNTSVSGLSEYMYINNTGQIYLKSTKMQMIDGKYKLILTW